ncbi:MAG: Clp protease N-terminal domain-containing protein [Patescibacteria group bacterium]
MNIDPREQVLLESWGLSDVSITAEARAVLLAARTLAEASTQTGQFEAVETGHLLLALAQNKSGVVNTVLLSFNITVETIEEVIASLKKNLTYHEKEGVGSFSAVVQATSIEAQILSDGRIDTEHLLIAVARSNSLMGSAERIFRDLGVAPAEIIKKTVYFTKKGQTEEVIMGDTFLNFGGKIFILPPEFIRAMFESTSDSGRINPKAFIEKLAES